MAVFGMFDGGQSLPLAGQETTTLTDPTELPPMDPPGKASLYIILIHNMCRSFRCTRDRISHVHSSKNQKGIKHNCCGMFVKEVLLFNYVIFLKKKL